tara:strand:- start:1293 stop:1934 length:642 start_codon:yes stop_codon:yes gene_type:complete
MKVKILRPLEVYILSIAFFFSVSFDRNLNLDDVDDSPVKGFLENIHLILDSFTNYEHPLGAIFLIFILGLIIWILLGKQARFTTDVYATVLSFAWLLELVSMNLLLVSPLKDPVLLLVELVLFVPIILIGFSWWYWRLNHQSRLGKGKAAITFDKKPTPFSYFAKTASIVVSDTTEHGVCETDIARALRIMNGFVVLDIFGLTLSRAVGLVIN